VCVCVGRAPTRIGRKSSLFAHPQIKSNQIKSKQRPFDAPDEVVVGMQVEDGVGVPGKGVDRKGSATKRKKERESRRNDRRKRVRGWGERERQRERFD
jgi:hypothetical protein